MRRVVVTFAVRAEFAPWRRLRGFTRVNQAGEPTYMVHWGSAEVYAVITGIGARRAHEQLRKLLSTPADACIVSGLAGSLKQQHAAGTTLVAKSVKCENAETVIRSDEHLVEIATECGATPVDFFCTAEAVINSPSEKLRLGKTADAVEMESFHVMSEAREFGVPAVAVRSISDPVDRIMPMDFNQVIDKNGEIAWIPALSQVAAEPRRLPQLMRFGFESSRAARKLAHFLDEYLTEVR